MVSSRGKSRCSGCVVTRLINPKKKGVAPLGQTLRLRSGRSGRARVARCRRGVEAPMREHGDAGWPQPVFPEVGQLQPGLFEVV